MMRGCGAMASRATPPSKLSSVSSVSSEVRSPSQLALRDLRGSIKGDRGSPDLPSVKAPGGATTAQRRSWLVVVDVIDRELVLLVQLRQHGQEIPHRYPHRDALA